MCGGSERLNLRTTMPPSCDASEVLNSDMSNSVVTMESNHSFSCLLELAADNDVEGFKRLACNASSMDEIGVWYSYQKGLKHMVLERRTPLMIAARYGSVDVVKVIISQPGIDVNCICEPEKSTALHCAASGGSSKAAEVMKLLLLAGADPNAIDANGKRPVDVIIAHPDFPDMKLELQELLRSDGALGQEDMQLSATGFGSLPPSLPSSCENGFSSKSSNFSDVPCKPDDEPVSSAREKKEYPVDVSLPDIKNSMYSTDEFRMYSFKIRPCSRAYSHDWTECPFVHPGENARRRDPRKFHYSSVPCPDFRKGACKRGDLCEYAHGVFESWLHPAQYRTRLCKDGTSCPRRVCFFAHRNEELRPLYLSAGSGGPSPRSTSSALIPMDMAAVLSLLPGSPSAMSAMSSPFSPPMSPTVNGNLHLSMPWPQQSMPTLHLPGSNFQASRLRSSLNVRDLTVEEFGMLPDFEAQHQKHPNGSCASQPHVNCFSVRPSVHSKTLAPSNLEELFSAEISSPRCYDKHAASSVFSPAHNSMFRNQLQQQSMLSPIRTNVLSPMKVDHPFFQAPLGFSSPHGMSPRCAEPLSPMCRLPPSPHSEKLQQEPRILKSWGTGVRGAVGSPINSGAKWGSLGAKLDWSIEVDESIQLPKSNMKGHKGDAPDLSWVQSLVKESPYPIKTHPSVPASAASLPGESPNFNSNPLGETTDRAVLGAWLEQLQLDPVVS